MYKKKALLAPFLISGMKLCSIYMDVFILPPQGWADFVWVPWIHGCK